MCERNYIHICVFECLLLKVTEKSFFFNIEKGQLLSQSHEECSVKVLKLKDERCGYNRVNKHSLLNKFCSLRCIQMSIFLELFKKKTFLTIYVHYSKCRNSLKNCSIDQIFFLQVQNIPIKFLYSLRCIQMSIFWSYSRKTYL